MRTRVLAVVTIVWCAAAVNADTSAGGAAPASLPETLEQVASGKLPLEPLVVVRRHRAWEQRTPDRRPVPDESRARLLMKQLAWRRR